MKKKGVNIRKEKDVREGFVPLAATCNF